MDSTQKTVFVDDEIASQVLAVVREARHYVVLVSPYLDLTRWGHLQDALGLAVKRRANVVAIVRYEPDVVQGKSVSELVGNGVKVWGVKGLHAKIYLNEHTVLVSSMNLTESSTKNSLEIALVIRDKEAEQQVRSYVTERLLKQATPVEQIWPKEVRGPAPKPVHAVSRHEAGACIRCGKPTPLNPSRPLCAACYDVWAEWGNEEYPEAYCHACGKRSGVTYARPLCSACFSRLR
ncbi:MAG: phosphatidylserine/phosphatidylglycerophosphate/cardiolipin synthase family protein [Chloroflexi bacterium]|nr:phosphatidylserine/phosphatidylglycerophosphate/cardiolipin synthase family protein [Chloroflexota bacterium]